MRCMILGNSTWTNRTLRRAAAIVANGIGGSCIAMEATGLLHELSRDNMLAAATVQASLEEELMPDSIGICLKQTQTLDSAAFAAFSVTMRAPVAAGTDQQDAAPATGGEASRRATLAGNAERIGKRRLRTPQPEGDAEGDAAGDA